MTCLDDDTVLGLVEGRRRDVVDLEEHLDTCRSCRDVVAQVARSRIPERVGGYVLGELLGIGAMGRVYAAVQPGLGRNVAVKLMTGDDLREAQAMARLDHPNVVTVHEVGNTDDGVFVVMELVDGRDLRAWTGKPWREVLPLLVDTARGLAAVHAAGVVHRDVKPDNIIVGADRRARLGDFGLARAGEHTAIATEGVAFCKGTSVAGTPVYMAPEVLEGRAATAASDQFSFGVTAYELVAGKRPFAARPGDTWADLLAATRAAPRPLPAPRWLDDVVARCLAADPAARFADMAEVARILADRSAPRRPAAWIATGLAIAAVASVVTYAGTRGSDAPPAPRSSIAPVLLGEAKILRGLQQFAPAAVLARETLATAERDHDDLAASEAWVLRVAIAGDRRDLAAADDLGAVAAGAIDRAGAPARLTAELARLRGMIAYDRGELPAAKALLQSARSRSISAAGEQSLAVAAIDSGLGSVARAAGELDVAERRHRAALATDRALHGDVARDLHNLAGVLRLRGELDEALATYREALAMETGVDAGLTHNSIALVEMAHAQWPAARADLDAAKALLAGHGDLALVEHNLGLVAMSTGDPKTALAHYAEAERIYGTTIGLDAEDPRRLRGDRTRAEAALRARTIAVRPIASTLVEPPKPPQPPVAKPPVDPPKPDVGAYGARRP